VTLIRMFFPKCDSQKIEVRAETDSITDNKSFHCFRFFFQHVAHVIGVVRSNFFIGQTKFM
jgi:hypothetical protein